VIRRVDAALSSTAAISRRAFGGDEHPAYVVVDVLRASTTIVTALANGARAVVPAAEPAEAVAIAATMPKSAVLLGGERGGTRIAGFDLDNSPRAYDASTVAGKTIVFTTTNGTRALLELGAIGEPVIVGALVNANAVARAVLASQADSAILVCAGQDGAFSLEDLLGAGAIASRLSVQASYTLEFDDMTAAAVRLFAACSAELFPVVRSAAHARTLERLGLSGDVDVCARLDVFDSAPTLRDGAITP
jgi:2-phosphosulfolactate phosphatase